MMGDVSDSERGVSTVVGAVVLVGVTVVLAATTGAYLLDLGSSADEGVRAGATTDIGGGEVTVRYVDATDEDTTLRVTVTEVTDRSGTGTASGTATLTADDRRHTWRVAGTPDLGSGDEVRVTVVAVEGDSRSVVLRRTGVV